MVSTIYDHNQDRIMIRVFAVVPQAVVNYTTPFVNGNCCASWKV